MPVKIGSTDIPRIKAGNETIKRVYQGNTLVYGLYDVHYYDRNNVDIYNPKEYAGGYRPETVDVVFPKPNDTSNPNYVLDGYPTHGGDSSGLNGGYNEYTLKTQRSNIALNEHDDLDLYAKGRQHRFSFSGDAAITYYEGEGGGGGGGSGDFLDNNQLSGTYPYSETWNGKYGPGGSVGLQCTGYCYNRSGHTTGYFMPSNSPISAGGSGPDGNLGGTGGVNGEPTDVLRAGCCISTNASTASAGHVIFVERIEGTTVTCSDTYISFGYGYGSGGAPGTRDISELSIGSVITAGNATFPILRYVNNPNV